MTRNVYSTSYEFGLKRKMVAFVSLPVVKWMLRMPNRQNRDCRTHLPRNLPQTDKPRPLTGPHALNSTVLLVCKRCITYCVKIVEDIKQLIVKLS